MNKLGNLPAMTPFSEKRKGKKNTGWGKNSAHREKKRDLRLNFLQKRPILKKHHRFLGFPHRVFKMEKDFNVNKTFGFTRNLTKIPHYAKMWDEE